jgi:hypothetical protein
LGAAAFAACGEGVCEDWVVAMPATGSAKPAVRKFLREESGFMGSPSNDFRLVCLESKIIVRQRARPVAPIPQAYA